MEEKTQVNMCTIQSLPYEIIIMILQNTNYTDIIHFGSTCKELNELVKSNQYLWKEQFKCMFPNQVFNEIDKNIDGDWLGEVKTFYKVKKEVYSKLLEMSPIHYWQNNELKMENVKKMFHIALSRSSTFYYIVNILQDTVRKGNQYLNEYIAKGPFTLTEMYYAKNVLCYLINTYLTVKWVQAHERHELHPDTVLNFFMQWVDPLNMHWEEEIKCAINDLVGQVEILLLKDYPSKFPIGCNIQDKCLRGSITERQVLAAVTQVLYHQRHIAIMSAGNLDTLDIIKVLKNKCGNEVVVATIYQAVAKKFGVICDLIAFPNHLFLEWRSSKDELKQIFKINIENGELQPKRHCPYSRNTSATYNYCPDSFIKYIIYTFLMTMGEYKTWYTQNAVHLLDFLTNNPNNDNPFKNFHPYLLESIHKTASPINITYLHGEHLQTIEILILLNKGSEAQSRDRIVKTRDHGIKYAVGMICCHRKYDYICIIRDWHYKCVADWQNRTEIASLQFGPKQPFYVVIAADQSDRYVAQESLVEIMQPRRIYHLEDTIAKEFTHFNGFSYIPNNEKMMEYPEDAPICEQFRQRAQLSKVVYY